jgi:hypothetical protein
MLLALPFPGFDQVLQTAGALDGSLAALCATLVALHAQLIFPLPRHRQVRELVRNDLWHDLAFPPAD